jgi:hypothetical protein
MVRTHGIVPAALALAACLIIAHSAPGTPVAGWSKDTSFGGGAAAALTAANTSSPILGSGASNNADNAAIYAPFPLISLANGQQLTLSGSAQMVGTTANPDFRWGLFKDDGVGAAAGGWLGFIASAESFTWSKDPSGGNFANVTFASVADGRGAVLGQTADPNATPFSTGTYQFSMSLQRYSDDIDVTVSFTNAITGYSIVSPTFTETAPSRLTFAFDRVGFLAGSALDADQIRFSNIDVAVSNIDQPVLEVHSSGLVVVTNPTGGTYDLTQYEITSDAGSLNPSGWTSFDSQENDDPIGSGWDEAGGSGATVLGEVNLLSTESLDADERLGLGHAYAPGDERDLAFRFTSGGEVERGVVRYVESGDFNRDGHVDAADYVLWRKTAGTASPVGAGADANGDGAIDDSDLNVFKNNFGNPATPGLGQASSAPEPSALLAAVFATLMLLPQPLRRTRRNS